MIRKIFSFLIVSALLFLPLSAVADPGVGAWASSGDTYLYEFDDDTDSAVRNFTNGPYTVCFDPDDSSSGAATAQVTIQRVVSTETSFGSLAVNGLTLTGAAGANCIFEVPSGRYWVDVTTDAGGDDATVSFHKP